MRILSGDVNWGILGVGNVCENKSGPAFSKVPNSELTAVMRRTPGMARDYARRHKVPKHFEKADELLNDKQVNAIYIATPPAFHEQYALAAMRAGKAVYIEKPVTLNAHSCQQLIDAANKYQVPVSIAHYRRRLPLFEKVRELIKNNAIGEIQTVNISLLQAPRENIIAQTETNWRINPELSGGGLFHDLAPHQLDILYWLFGAPVSYNGNSLNKGKKYNAPDYCELNAIFPHNIELQGIWSFNCNESDTEDVCEIQGTLGKLRFSFFRNPILTIETELGFEKLELPYPKHVQQPMIADVVQYFRGNISNPCSLEDALCTMRMMDATK